MPKREQDWPREMNVVAVSSCPSKSVRSPQGVFVGLANYVEYFKTPALSYSIYQSLHVAILSTVITVPLAFVYAYALTRNRVPVRPWGAIIGSGPVPRSATRRGLP